VTSLRPTPHAYFAFAVVHEMPAPAPFFAETARAMKTGAAFLLAEPAGRVDGEKFVGELAAAAQAGLVAISHQPLRGSHAALFCKPTSWVG